LCWIASSVVPFRKDIFYAVITRPQGRGDPAAMAAEILDCFVGGCLLAKTLLRSVSQCGEKRVAVCQRGKKETGLLRVASKPG